MQQETKDIIIKWIIFIIYGMGLFLLGMKWTQTDYKVQCERQANEFLKTELDNIALKCNCNMWGYKHNTDLKIKYDFTSLNLTTQEYIDHVKENIP